MNTNKTLPCGNVDLLEPGSHNGRELDLMLCGLKPMAAFIAEDAMPAEFVGDAKFESYVRERVIIKFIYRNEEICSERRCYCLPGEEWRCKLSNFIFKLSCEGDLTAVFTPSDRAKIDGFLLGYSKEAINKHLMKLASHHTIQKKDQS